MYISRKDKLGYITGDSPQPLEIDPFFRKWRIENAIVQGWLINSMEPSLIGNFIRFPTAKQEDRVYVFLDGLDDQLDKVRSDVLQLQSFPTVEQAYAHVRREDIRQAVMTSGSDITPGAVMASKGFKPEKPKSKPQSDGGKCTHCDNMKHTRETCFKLHGYPEWWNDFQARKKREGTSTNEGTGRAVVASVEPHLSLTAQPELTNPFTPLSDQGNCGQVLVTSHDHDDSMWIIDSGATDHMTFDSHDFSHITQPRRTRIVNANGVQYPVTGAGTLTLSSSLSLNHTLLVPSLSNKLLFVSQVTTDLNCVVLMYPTFCFLQDILTKEIIGRGTKKGGLYYMDDFNSGKANQVRHTISDKERQIWLLHNRLGHP
ncbi:hypothetical protein MRB53_015641 [Persea americana]|uniref:Uncharacterized protein n=1 Tax=Persea americana TaxID=3435 RepID=A0ACC2LZU9_PERAE|nr:hypothetical protein MRB53_015641 [Persea americana]